MLAECGFEDEGYYAALVRMFDQSLLAVMVLEPAERQKLLPRLDKVRSAAGAVGWGVKDAMDELWADNVLKD